MKVQAFVFNYFEENTYIVWDEPTGEAAVVDPGMLHARECDELFGFVSENGLTVKHLINTHLHLDHTFGNDAVTARYGVKAEAHPDDAFLGAMRTEQARHFRLKMELGPVEIGHELHDGDIVGLGESRMEVILVPGHSPGSICLYSAEDGWVISGDVVFPGSIGRTDLPWGDFNTLVTSIRRRLLSLPPQTVIYPGHGPATTVGRELRANPFLR